MSSHSRKLDKCCPHCKGPMFYDSLKTPHVDDGGETCHGTVTVYPKGHENDPDYAEVEDCRGNTNPIASAWSQARSNARAEDAE